MIRVTYTITMPSGLDNMPTASPEAIAYRENLLVWSWEHGMVDQGFNENPEKTVRIVSYDWIDQAALDAFFEEFDPAYTEYYNEMVSQIEAVPATFVRTEEEIEGVPEIEVVAPVVKTKGKSKSK
jgi:hypothetical protein